MAKRDGETDEQRRKREFRNMILIAVAVEAVVILGIVVAVLLRN